jgi:NAD(P)-dependent dehydrogenase (short-subunit alcohol dehydrogenase family)
LGKVIASKLSEAGAEVVLNYRQQGGRSEAGAKELAREISEQGSRASTIQADISQRDSVNAMFDQIASEYGRLDLLILNAARAPFKSLKELLRRDLLQLVETNYLGNIHCMQRALPLMESNGGSVVFISSLGSRFALPGYPLGSMKAAMECLVQHWSEELADRKIHVNGVTAGLLKTDSFKTLRQVWPGLEQMPESYLVELEQVANVVVFLCSDASRGLRGQMLVVDNGLSNSLFRFSETSSSTP